MFSVNYIPAEENQISQHSHRKLSKLNQSNKQQMPKMSPHVNSLEDASQQHQTSNTQNQQTVTQLANSHSNQSSPLQGQAQPQHSR